MHVFFNLALLWMLLLVETVGADILKADIFSESHHGLDRRALGIDMSKRKKKDPFSESKKSMGMMMMGKKKSVFATESPTEEEHTTEAPTYRKQVRNNSGMMMMKSKKTKSQKVTSVRSMGMMGMSRGAKSKSASTKGKSGKDVQEVQAPTAVFEVYNSCQTDGGCIGVGVYDELEYCEWTVSADASLSVTFFDVENGWDFLFVGELEPFTGTGINITNVDGVILNNLTVTAGDVIRFQSDSVGSATGFEICLT
uniref:DOMON domain-containing protein n=1 Tax=Amphora coffeiformis TaxID=265554 RepID=A0A7S3L768_9STRA|eukprot:scaffold15108_cov180-Amphora_coffeaeformis.AAC.24